MWMACQLHCAYEEKCPARLSDALHLLEPGSWLLSQPQPLSRDHSAFANSTGVTKSFRFFSLCVVTVPEEITGTNLRPLETHSVQTHWNKLNMTRAKHGVLHVFFKETFRYVMLLLNVPWGGRPPVSLTWQVKVTGGVQAWDVGRRLWADTLVPGPRMFLVFMLLENQRKGVICFYLVPKAVETVVAT